MESFKSLAFKAVDSAISVKFIIIVITCAFFYLGKLDATTWQQTILMVAGLRAVNEVAGMVADAKAAKSANDTTVALAALKGKQPVDDPDASEPQTKAY